MTINTALNSGACDCTDCSIVSNNCTIPFIFNSNTTGKLEYSDININWLEYTTPNLTINTPTGNTIGTTINYDFTIQDDLELQNCHYNVTRGASLEIANTNFDCSTETTGNFVVSSSATSYIVNVFTNDTSGNINTSNSAFTTSTGGGGTPPTGGSGGSTTIIVGEEQGWTMEVTKGVGRFDVEMPKGISRKLNIQFENTGDSSREITLTCENIVGSACQYVEFLESPFNLPRITDVKLKIPFIINLPDDVVEGDFSFNIRATDELNQNGAITVFLGIETNFFISTISKIFLRTQDGFPIALIFFPLFIVLIFVFVGVLPKDTPIKPIIVFLLSLIISLGVVSIV